MRSERLTVAVMALTAVAVSLLAISMAEAQRGGSWTAKPLARLLPGGEEKTDKDVKLKGKLISKEDEDERGNKVTRAFLEQDDGELIPLPCEKRTKDRGLAKKAADNALGGKDSCWDFMGEEVELVGDVQSISKAGRRFKRLGRISKIVPLP